MMNNIVENVFDDWQKKNFDIWENAPDKKKVIIIQAPSRLVDNSVGWVVPWYRDMIGNEFCIDERFKNDPEQIKRYNESGNMNDVLFYSEVYMTWIAGKLYGINKNDCVMVGD
jgi:hypothetical protein